MGSLWHPFSDMAAVREHEFVVDRAEGAWVYDEAGRAYLDGCASLWYANVGHGRREIVDAAMQQMSRLEAYSCFADIANRPALELADRLAALAPTGPDTKVFLGSGGADAIDTAVKIARAYWQARGEHQRVHVVSRETGYHGTHGYGTSIVGIPANREGWGVLAGENTVAPQDLDGVEKVFADVGPERIAAFVMEPVTGAGGVHIPAPGYVEGVAELCRRHGVLLVIDSVICGFGRLGTWFGIERFGVQPDLVTFAKGVTAGYLPLGGVLVSAAVAEPWWTTPGERTFRHGPTYSGHPTCCAAALATLDVYERERLIPRGQELETALEASLAPLREHPYVAEVRAGFGLLAAVELTPEVLSSVPDAPNKVLAGARAAGLLVRGLGKGVAVSPPLIVTDEEIRLLGEGIRAGLDALPDRTPVPSAPGA
ncbi:aspartate aminotransferase family protein [Actinomycetospora sp. NBRC 106378]|uniref:aminotransferase family protein n=1 Tax=Actinomycetospora sp. NBRC 106378 TaxID=3032208 RepID=UPI0024A123F4|nr:aspartate aminotransferase family protein [Actinomycetospora sp. NBRC 106378]GLZ53010.1 aspartate aminotransferase family protein [Actinomycetospora sp. NBRC 106378]